MPSAGLNPDPDIDSVQFAYSLLAGFVVGEVWLSAVRGIFAAQSQDVRLLLVAAWRTCQPVEGTVPAAEFDCWVQTWLALSEHYCLLAQTVVQ